MTVDSVEEARKALPLLDEAGRALLFTSARTANSFAPTAVTDAELDSVLGAGQVAADRGEHPAAAGALRPHPAGAGAAGPAHERRQQGQDRHRPGRRGARDGHAVPRAHPAARPVPAGTEGRVRSQRHDADRDHAVQRRAADPGTSCSRCARTAWPRARWPASTRQAWTPNSSPTAVGSPSWWSTSAIPARIRWFGRLPRLDHADAIRWA